MPDEQTWAYAEAMPFSPTHFNHDSDDTPAFNPAEFRRRVLAQVAQIPSGRVMTYGQLAMLAGHMGAARQAGRVLAGLAESAGSAAEGTQDGTSQAALPWQRVVNAQGRLSTGKVGLGELQRALLEAEGVQFDSSGRLDLRALMWWPDNSGASEEQRLL